MFEGIESVRFFFFIATWKYLFLFIRTDRSCVMIRILKTDLNSLYYDSSILVLDLPLSLFSYNFLEINK